MTRKILVSVRSAFQLLQAALELDVDEPEFCSAIVQLLVKSVLAPKSEWFSQTGQEDALAHLQSATNWPEDRARKTLQLVEDEVTRCFLHGIPNFGGRGYEPCNHEFFDSYSVSIEFK